MSIKQTLASLLEQSVLIRGFITSVIVGTMCYLYIAQLEVPDTLVNIVLLVVGYYFGAMSERKVR